MALTSLQVCMDSADWLQGTITDESGMDSSSPSGDMLTCPRPLVERRLRPQQDQGLKCPRCDSTHTKFCYYNNYSLSQPRYFCKTCKRYWTKGGTLRNIPEGGGYRKNKKVSSKKSNDQSVNNQVLRSPSSSFSPNNPTDLHLYFPDMQPSHLNNFLGNHRGLNSTDFMGTIFENNPRPIDFNESKYEALVGSLKNSDFRGMGDHELNTLGGFGEMNHGLTPNFNFHYSPFGMSTLEGNCGILMDSCQSSMLPYDGTREDQNSIDVKPNKKLLCLEWQDQGCSDALNGLGLMAPAGYSAIPHLQQTHYYC